MIQFIQTISITKTIPSQSKFFSCGEYVLDEYLKRYARNHEKINIGRTFVLLDCRGEKKDIVVGYYTLCCAQLHIDDLPLSHKEKLPKYPIPASRLCRLAVDQTVQGQRVGEYLLADAIQRVLQADTEMAIHSLIVDAKNLKAKKFYSKYGFLSLSGSELTLFLPLNTLRKSKSLLEDPVASLSF